jgi:hypothetical protein
MSRKPAQDLVMQVKRCCTGTGFTKLFCLNMTGNPVQDLVMQVDRSCTGSLKFPDFLDMMSRILDSRYYKNKVNNLKTNLSDLATT